MCAALCQTNAAASTNKQASSDDDDDGGGGDDGDDVVVMSRLLPLPRLLCMDYTSDPVRCTYVRVQGGIKCET